MTIQCYIAGKYTDTTRTREVQNISNALVAGVAMTLRGFRPIVPHAAGSHWVSHETAMERCRHIIRSMNPEKDFLVLIPGWETSKGAVEEAELARTLGMPVLTLEEALRLEVAS